MTDRYYHKIRKRFIELMRSQDPLWLLLRMLFGGLVFSWLLNVSVGSGLLIIVIGGIIAIALERMFPSLKVKPDIQYDKAVLERSEET